MEIPGDITQLLSHWRQGQPHALDELVAQAYPRLRGIADAFLRREANCLTLQATGLVNELYLLLRRQRTVDLLNREDFFSFSAYLTRLILLNRARERMASKRSGGVRVPLTEDLSWVDAAGHDMIDLDRALGELGRLDPRKVQILDLTAFLGCTKDEAASLLGISRATVERELRFTRAWLHDRLRGRDAGVERAGL